MRRGRRRRLAGRVLAGPRLPSAVDSVRFAGHPGVPDRGARLHHDPAGPLPAGKIAWPRPDDGLVPGHPGRKQPGSHAARGARNGTCACTPWYTRCHRRWYGGARAGVSPSSCFYLDRPGAPSPRCRFIAPAAYGQAGVNASKTLYCIVPPSGCSVSAPAVDAHGALLPRVGGRVVGWLAGSAPAVDAHGALLCLCPWRCRCGSGISPSRRCACVTPFVDQEVLGWPDQPGRRDAWVSPLAPQPRLWPPKRRSMAGRPNVRYAGIIPVTDDFIR